MLLRERVFAAVRWTSASAILRGALQLIQLTVIARLLQPAEFGLVAATAAIVALCSLVADLGLNAAYLHARDVSEDQRSALYWLNVGAGTSLTALVFILSPLAAYGLGSQQIAPLLQWYSLVFLISALGLQLRYDAEKRLEFRKVALIEVVATLSGICVAIGAALADGGAISIVFGALTAACTNATLNWLFLSAGWRPRLRVNLYSAKPFLRFGIASIANGIVTQLSTNLDMLVGGRLLGVGQFGLYAAPRNLFMQLLSLINPIVTRVGFPVIAHLNNDRERSAQVYRKTLQAVAGISAPLYIGAAVFAETLVAIIFGPGWSQATTAFQLLAIWALCRSVMNPVGGLLFGMGRPGLALQWNLFQLAVAPALFYLAKLDNATDLALAMLVLMGLQLLPAWYFLIKPLCNLKLHDYVLAVTRPFALACVSAAIVVATTGIDALVPIEFVLSAITFGILYVLFSWMVKEEWLSLLLQQAGIDIRRKKTPVV